MFYDKAERTGVLGKKVPLLHQQSQYYRRFIKNHNMQLALDPQVQESSQF